MLGVGLDGWPPASPRCVATSAGVKPLNVLLEGEPPPAPLTPCQEEKVEGEGRRLGDLEGEGLRARAWASHSCLVKSRT